MNKLRKPRLVKRLAACTAVFLAVLSAAFSFAPSVSAFDAYGKPTYNAGGYTAWRSFFKDYAPVSVAGYDVLPRQAVYGDNSMPAITDPASFVNFMRDNYNEAINSDTQDDGAFNFGWRKTGSAFIGWTMLGVTPGNMGPSGTPGSRETSPDWNELLNRLNGLNAAGKISWNVPVSTFDYGGVNTRYLGAPYDDVQAITLPSSTGNGIVFHDYNNNVAYVIRYNCANPLGAFPGVPPRPASSATLEGFVLEENTGNQLPANTTVSGVGTAANTGVFRFNSAAPGYSPDVPAGWHDVWVDNIPSGWTVVGSTLCGGPSPCNPGQPSSSTSGQNFAPGNFRTINFDPDSHHHLRWILRRVTTLSCIPPTVTPSIVEPSTTYTVNVGANVQPAASAGAYAAGATASVSVVGPGVNYNRTVPVTASGGTVVASVVPGPTNNSGVYSIFFTVSGPLGSVTCAGSFTVGYHPYFRVEAGDVTAGAGFTKADGTCSASTAAQIRGSNTGASGSPAFLGAGAQLGALALGAISNFPTSTNDGGGSSGVGAATRTGLTFANTPSLGNFGSLPCTPDYATEALSTATSIQPLGTGSYNLATLASGTYQVTSGDVTLSGTIPHDRKITIVVMGGNAIIDGTIKYGGYSSLASAPQFKLIVANGGNIKIKNDVTELHGVYIALPNAAGGGGALSTCYDMAAGADSVDYATCNHKLTFYGAVVVNTLLLERTYGSVTSGGGTPREPAETFNNTPELWGAPGPSTSSSGAQPFDSIVSLPPVL